MSDDTAPIWQRLDQHAERIDVLSRETAALHAQQKAMEERMKYIAEMMAEHRAESRESSKAIVAQLKEVAQAVNQARGGLKMGIWIFAAITTVIGLGIAGWKLIFDKAM